MAFSEMAVTVLAAAVFGGAFLAAIWPGRRQGRRVLVRWGIADPGDTEIAEAVRYLKRRRLWYPWVLVAAPALAGVYGVPESWRSTGSVLGALVAGALLAEVVAQRPTRTLQRTAPLVPRRVTDLVSWWSIAAFAVLAIGTVGVSAAALAGARWALRLLPDPVPGLIGVLVVSVLGMGIVWLAVRRPSSGGSRADNALRLRSARVGAGLTMGTLGVVFSAGGDAGGQLVALAGVVCWIATVNPPASVLQEVVRA